MRDMDCLNNTVQHRQWSLCIRLFSGDDYSSGDLPIDSLQCRMQKRTKTMIVNIQLNELHANAGCSHSA